MWKTLADSQRAIEVASRGEGAPGDESRIAGPTMRACSACAGDYEDPDRTAGSEDKRMDEDTARGLDEDEADGSARSKNEVRPTRTRRDAVPEGFMTGE